jgi:hypothetical protein
MSGNKQSRPCKGCFYLHGNMSQVFIISRDLLCPEIRNTKSEIQI